MNDLLLPHYDRFKLSNPYDKEEEPEDDQLGDVDEDEHLHEGDE